MSLLFTGPGGSLEQRWIVYALLRDNVQHYLEGGVPSGRFETLHSISQALGRKTTVPALHLREELGQVEVLLTRPISELAISLRTHAIMSLSWPLPERRATMLVGEWGGRIELPVAEPRVLGDVFGSLLGGLLRVSAPAGEQDVIEVTDL